MNFIFKYLPFLLCTYAFNGLGQTIKSDSIFMVIDYSDICINYKDKYVVFSKEEEKKLLKIINGIGKLSNEVRENLYIRLVPYNDYKKNIGILRAKYISNYLVRRKVLDRFRILIVELTDFEGNKQNKVCVEVRIGDLP